MPLIRLPNAKMLYFTHVPKCAGTSVEDYLRDRFGLLGLLDRRFGKRSAPEAWTHSPPQHMPEAVRAELLPDTLFNGIFATVRHPATRLRSVSVFQRAVECSIPANTSFPVWVEALPRMLATDPYALHGHLRPMSETVPLDANVFRIEQGLADLIDWLDEIAGDAGGPRKIGRANITAERMRGTMQQVQLNKAVLGRIATIYAADYARFGYDLGPPPSPRSPKTEPSS